MRLFKKAGINLLTLPVFSMGKAEPDEGVYNFEWLDRIIDKIWENGIHVCLATPTYCTTGLAVPPDIQKYFLLILQEEKEPMECACSSA